MYPGQPAADRDGSADRLPSSQFLLPLGTALAALAECVVGLTACGLGEARTSFRMSVHSIIEARDGPAAEPLLLTIGRAGVLSCRAIAAGELETCSAFSVRCRNVSAATSSGPPISCSLRTAVSSNGPARASNSTSGRGVLTSVVAACCLAVKTEGRSGMTPAPRRERPPTSSGLLLLRCADNEPNGAATPLETAARSRLAHSRL